MKLTTTIRDAFVRAAMADVPKVDYRELIRKAVQEDAAAQLPPKARALFKDPELCHFININIKYLDDHQSVAIPGARNSAFKLTEPAQAKVATLQAQMQTQDEQHKALRERLKAVAYSVTTRKALAEALPEFEKYLPADEGAALRTVPVVANVVADFVRAGWPKGGKKAVKREAVAA